jgi:hypothetical protein
MIFFNHIYIYIYIYIYISIYIYIRERERERLDKKLFKKYYLDSRKKKVMYKWKFFLQSLSAEIYKESTIKIKKKSKSCSVTSCLWK